MRLRFAFVCLIAPACSGLETVQYIVPPTSMLELLNRGDQAQSIARAAIILADGAAHEAAAELTRTRESYDAVRTCYNNSLRVLQAQVVGNADAVALDAAIRDMSVAVDSPLGELRNAVSAIRSKVAALAKQATAKITELLSRFQDLRERVRSPSSMPASAERRHADGLPVTASERKKTDTVEQEKEDRKIDALERLREEQIARRTLEIEVRTLGEKLERSERFVDDAMRLMNEVESARSAAARLTKTIGAVDAVYRAEGTQDPIESSVRGAITGVASSWVEWQKARLAARAEAADRVATYLGTLQMPTFDDLLPGAKR